jgi:hypothetical protein
LHTSSLCGGYFCRVAPWDLRPFSKCPSKFPSQSIYYPFSDAQESVGINRRHQQIPSLCIKSAKFHHRKPPCTQSHSDA